MATTPRTHDDKMYRLLRSGKIAEFNTRKASGEKSDLLNGDFRGLDLRGLDAAGLDLRGCYFRQTDLRGIDFSTSNLEGASIHGARISGSYFPRELTAEEINLSLTNGTRMRYSPRG